MVSFAEACLFSALEGEAKFGITLYRAINSNPQTGSRFLQQEQNKVGPRIFMKTSDYIVTDRSNFQPDSIFARMHNLGINSSTPIKKYDIVV